MQTTSFAQSSGQPERRRHRLYLTRNTEYHLRDRLCVGIRDRRSGDWISDHPALGRTLFGALRNENGLESVNDPVPGTRLWFEDGERDIITSRLHAVRRPTRESVATYAA